MNKLVSMLVLALAAAPTFALPTANAQVPEPEMLPLLMIGAIGMLVARRFKK